MIYIFKVSYVYLSNLESILKYLRVSYSILIHVLLAKGWRVEGLRVDTQNKPLPYIREFIIILLRISNNRINRNHLICICDYRINRLLRNYIYLT